MIRSFNGKTPKIAGSAFVSEAAYVIGDVEIGENSGVWPGAVIRADFASIRIGSNTHIEDNAILHTGIPLEIGDNVIIGHSAVVHCRKIGNGVLVGNNATILDFAEIGDSCIIGANSMVAMGRKIPGNSLVVGVPAEVKRELSPEEVGDMYARLSRRYSQISGRETPHLSYSDLAKRYKEQGL